jgi:EAL domain-containing protein (putative c-di-GMP-specific phosphodiesterase class I)
MSVRQLAAEGFEESVARLLSASGLPADQLMLEITESRLVGETGPALTALQRLRALGVVLAIDDFGTGYSSLAYLRRLPVRVLKIDRTLLDGLGSDPKVATLVRAVVGMARALGLLVVAEGLEDLETARLVRDLGAYAGQGFAISPAVAPEVMTALLEETALDLDAVAPRPRRVDVS